MSIPKKHYLLNRIAVIVMLILPFGIAHAQYDPPTRVARLNYFDGPVSFKPAGSNTWAYAMLNHPMTTGDQVWVDKGGRSELHFGSTALRLGSQTSMTISTLDDTTVQLSLNQGTMNLNVRTLPAEQNIEVDTPNLAFTVQSPGEYRLNVDPNGQTTAVIVRSGNGLAQGDGGARVPVGLQQEIVFSGTALQQVSADSVPPYDGFDNWLAQRDRREDQSISARYVSRDMIGYEELDNYGTWSDDPNYGHIWIPTNPGVGWAPYHAGHWAWVAPWGWTWVDDQPWGFAPAHYGRWAYLQARWAWVPGPIAVRPVYAPALVAFVGGSRGNFSWSISLGGGIPGVAWFPLGPGEAYRPAYAVSPTYVNNLNKTVIINKTVNVTNVTNNNIVNNNITKTVYVNQNVPNAITAVPATSFVKGQPTAAAGQPVSAQQLSHSQVMSSSPAIVPVSESVMGATKPAPSAAPPTAVANRSVVATRAPAQPATLHDDLAAKFNTQDGVVPGAGKPMPQAPVANVAHPIASIRIVGPTVPVAEHSNRPTTTQARPTGPNVPGPARTADPNRSNIPAQASRQQPAQTSETPKGPLSTPALRENQPTLQVPHPPTVAPSPRPQPAPATDRNNEDRLSPQNSARSQPPRPPTEQQYRPPVLHPAPVRREESKPPPISEPRPRPVAPPQVPHPVTHPQEQAPRVPPPQVHPPAPRPKEELKPKLEEKEHKTETDRRG